MADETFIYQEVVEAGADAAAVRVSQEVAEVGASAAVTRIAQEVAEVGASASEARISQQAVELGASRSATRIAQLCIELGLGPEITPPADSPVGTFTFDEGPGSEWYLVLQLSDHGNELRDHVLKAVNVTGKVTNALVKFYRYGPGEPIDMGQLTAGSGFTAFVGLDDTNQVETSARFPVNIPNARVSTVRIEGRWTGNGIRDRLDQCVIEAAVRGIRR